MRTEAQSCSLCGHSGRVLSSAGPPGAPGNTSSYGLPVASKHHDWIAINPEQAAIEGGIEDAAYLNPQGARPDAQKLYAVHLLEGCATGVLTPLQTREHACLIPDSGKSGPAAAMSLPWAHPTRLPADSAPLPCRQPKGAADTLENLSPRRTRSFT